MKPYKFLSLLLSVIVLTVMGCGGGGGTSTPASVVVSGVASKGPIKNGLVKIFAINADGSKTLLQTATTGNGGEYTAVISSYTGPIYLEASGNYTDEATGASLTIQPNSPLRAALANVSGAVTVSVTPLTDLAVQKAASLTPSGITAANALVSDIFKVDIIATKPVEPTAAALADKATTQTQKDYTLALATLSQIASQAGGVSQMLTSLSADINANGKLSAATVATIKNAAVDFLASSNNQTGVTNINKTNLDSIGAGSVALNIATNGNLPAGTLIGGVELVLSLPPGVSARADFATGQTLDGIVVASGVAATGSLNLAKYTPSVAGAAATIKVGMVNPAGFGVGEFVTIHCDIASGTDVPAASQFILSAFKAVDVDPLTTHDISGLLSPVLTVM